MEPELIFSRTFHLKQNEKLIGTLYLYGFDFPWFMCKFKPTEAFDQFRPLFDEELKISEELSRIDADDWGIWDEIFERIASFGIRIIMASNGEEVEHQLLHIKGDDAWFR